MPHLLGIGVLLAVAVATRLMVFAQFSDHPLLQPSATLDDGAYVALARRLVAGDWTLGPDVYFLAPFYAYFMGAVFAATEQSLTAVRLVQAVLGAGTVGLVYLMGRDWFGHRAGLAAGTLAALTGVFAFYEVLLLQAALDPFLTALALFLFGRALRAPSVPLAVGAGVALACLILNRPNTLPFAAVAAAGLWWCHTIRARARQTVAFAAGLAMLLTPVAVRNRVVSGEWILVTSHGGLNFYIGNHGEADGTYTTVPGITPAIEGQLRDARALAERDTGRPLSAAEVSAYFYGRAWAWIRTHPGDAVALTGRKLALLLNAGDLALNYSFTFYSRDERTWLRWLVVGPWLILPLGLVGLVVMGVQLRSRAFAAWAAFVPVYGALVVAFFVSTRYRLPLLVPLCVTAGAAVSWTVDRIRERRWRPLGWAAAGLASAALAANWPLGADTGRRYERAEMAVYLAGAGRMDEAAAWLDRLEDDGAATGLVYFRVGQAVWLRGDAAGAVPLLAKALALDPGQPNVRLALGRALLDAGRAGDALPHLVAAVDAGVLPDAARLAAARAQAALGRTDEARASLAALFGLVPPPDSAAWLEAGVVALSLGDAPLAERALRVAAAADSVAPAVHERLGVALLMQDRAAEAIPVLERACAADATGAAARYNLAVALAREGRLAEARSRAVEALRLKPDYLQARQMLESLTGR